MNARDIRELVSKKFIENIGRVIKRQRRLKGYTQDNLSKDLGITEPTLSRYENGQIDIQASVMAHIAYVCGFDPALYAMPQKTEDEGKTLSDIFKEIVAAGREEKKPESSPEYSYISKPRYDRVDADGNLIVTYSKPKNKKFKKVLPAPTEEDNRTFEAYITAPYAKGKRELLEIAYYLMNAFRSQEIESKDTKTILRAMTRLIATDWDKDTNRMLKEYLDKCESLNDDYRLQ